MRTAKDVEKEYAAQGVEVTVEPVLFYPNLKSRYPVHWHAYSIDLPGLKRIDATCGFPTLADLELDIKRTLREVTMLLEYEKFIKVDKASRPYKANLAGAARIERYFVSKGLVVRILPASNFDKPTQFATRRKWDPTQAWGFATLTESGWVIDPDAYADLGRVAKYIYRLYKISLENQQQPN